MNNIRIVLFVCILAIPSMAFCPVSGGLGGTTGDISFPHLNGSDSLLISGDSWLLDKLSSPPDLKDPMKPLNISLVSSQSLISRVYPNASAVNNVSLSIFSPDEQEELADIRESIAKYKTTPVNQALKDTIARLKSQNSSNNGGKEGSEDNSLGLIPSPIDVVFLTSIGSQDLRGETLMDGAGSLPSVTGYASVSTPAAFDLRSTGKLTPVREQGQCGACWAFSTYGSLESTNLPASTWDFSENNMKNAHGFDLAPCQGGNYLMAAAYLSRWSGPVGESSDPYQESGTRTVQNVQPRQHVQEIIFLPSRQGPLDTVQVKQAIQKNGAVYSSIHWEKPLYSSSSHSYYYSGSSIQNHAVDIVGWDDTYSRYNFAVTPPGDGAFVVRNSWGDDWGDLGYFYVSYYDSIIGRELVQFFSEDTTNYDRIYSYDPLGWVTSAGSGKDTLYAANVFTAAGDEELRAVSFYTPVKGSSYQVEITKNPTNGPRGTSSKVVSTGTIAYAGYHTVTVDTPVTLEKGAKFSVIIRLTTPGYGYPVAVEYPLNGYSTQATARAGESFISSDGTSWTDLTQVVSNGNACIKAFTVMRKTPTPTPTLTPTPTKTPQSIFTPTTPTLHDTTAPVVSIVSPRFMASYSPGDTVQVSWSVKESGGISSVRVEYSLGTGGSWVTLHSSTSGTGTCTWKIPDNCAGTVTFRVTAVDNAGNSGSASRVVTVRTNTGKLQPLTSGIKIPSSPLGGDESEKMGTYSKIPVSETTGKTELQTETPVSSPNISRFKNTLASGLSIQDTALSSSVNLEKSLH